MTSKWTRGTGLVVHLTQILECVVYAAHSFLIPSRENESIREGLRKNS